MINQKNTFVSFSEQIALLNKNSVEVLTKLNDVVTDRNSVVDITLMNSDGTKSSYQLPTVGQLKHEIDIANRNIRKITGLADSTAYVSDGTTMRRIMVDDLNREPEPISNLNNVSKFVSVNNSFFESLSNPMLAVNVDLTDKIESNVKRVLSRRYIITFQKDENGDYTTDAQTSKADFETKFLSRNNIPINDLIDWYDNIKNYGVSRSDQPYDEQVFDLDYDQLQYYGTFDVIGIDTDTVNKKMWYVLGSLMYYDYSGNTKELTIGDQLIINKRNSSTKWEVKEVSTSKSNYRVVLERLEGIEPIPVLTEALKIYSPEVSTKNIKVSISYDEYNVIFVKAINTDANVIASTWSDGTSFFTNDLVLESGDNISMTKFYNESVFDYGSLLKDMIVKNVPSKYAAVPNIPEINSDNFKVVQINKHLTDSADSTKIKELHAQKTSLKSQLEQLSDAITEKTKEISTKKYKSASEKQSSQNQLNALIEQQTSLTKLYTSTVDRITSENTGNISNETPKFRIRGFWSFPEPVIVNTTGEEQTQEVVQFKIQYRYSAKGGSEPTTEGFELNITETFYTDVVSTGDISDQRRVYNNPNISTKDSTITGYFSNWNQFLTEAREREYNKALESWKWMSEDVSDANVPNINQLDLSIQQNEKVEIRIKSISEVGWPNAPIESDWSDILTIEFPDDLAQVGGENERILEEAKNEQVYTQIESKFDSKGLTTHLQQSYSVNDLYVAHSDVNLGTSFKDDTGSVIMLNDLLKSMSDKITALEEIVSRAKGELVVKLFRSSSEVSIDNGGTANITVNCEEYATIYGDTSRTYYNNVYVADDYYLQFENISTGSQLGLLSYRKYVPTLNGDNRFYNPTYAKGSLAPYVDSEDYLNVQRDNQFIWVSDTSGTEQIYNSGATFPSGLDKILYSNKWNLGVSGSDSPDDTGSYTTLPVNIFDDINWMNPPVTDPDYQSEFPVSVHPFIENIENYTYTEKSGTNLINPSSKFILPIKIFFKLTGDNVDSIEFPSNASTSPYVTRKLRVFLEPENLNRPFEFEVKFKIFRNRTYNLRTSSQVFSTT